jgi:hypothetical protein
VRSGAACSAAPRAGCDTGGVSSEVARPPLALTVALAIVVVESAVQAGFVIGRDDYGPGGKGLLVLAIGAKVLFAALARRLSAGGALGLLAFELVGILVALGAAWSMGLRLALVACVVAVYALVLSSLHAFPTPELP